MHLFRAVDLKAYDKLNEISVYRLLGITEYAIEEGLEINWNSHYANIHTLRCALKYKEFVYGRRTNSFFLLPPHIYKENSCHCFFDKYFTLHTV
jgi:hypothetical protein